MSAPLSFELHPQVVEAAKAAEAARKKTQAKTILQTMSVAIPKLVSHACRLVLLAKCMYQKYSMDP